MNEAIFNTYKLILVFRVEAHNSYIMHLEINNNNLSDESVIYVFENRI